MDSDNIKYEVKYCAIDNDFRVYCEFSDNLCIEG